MKIDQATARKIRNAFSDISNVSSVFARVDTTPHGNFLTVVFARHDQTISSDDVTVIRERLLTFWDGPVDVVPVSAVTPPIYIQFVRESFEHLAGENLPGTPPAFTSLISSRRRGAGTSPLD